MNDAQTKVTLSNKRYDNIKFFVTIVLPALGVLYASLALFWGFPKVEEVVGSITAIALFLGVVLKISSNNYEDPTQSVGNFVVTEHSGGKKSVKLDLEKDPEDFLENDVISFSLKKEEEIPEEDRGENSY